MNINESTNILVIFFAVFELIRDDKKQSPKKILDFIGDAKLSATTVKKHLATLIEWQALTPKHQRQGVAEEYINLQPTNIPEIVYKNKVSSDNKTRWKAKFADKTKIAKWVNNEAVFDEDGFAEAIPQEVIVQMINTVKNMFQPDKQKFDNNEAIGYFKDVFRGQKLDFDEIYLEDLHNWLCSEVKNFYSDT